MCWSQQKDAGFSTKMLGISAPLLEPAEMCWSQHKNAGASTFKLKSAPGSRFSQAGLPASTEMLAIGGIALHLLQSAHAARTGP
jgi:hypothetical protein